MTPEPAESLRNSQSPEKACTDKPVQVRGHPPHTTYRYNPTPKVHHEISKATMAPTSPKSHTITNSQLINTLSNRATKAVHAITKVLSWDCKNL